VTQRQDCVYEGSAAAFLTKYN